MVECYFNVCPLCKDDTKKVFLDYSNDAKISNPCARCGTRFKGYILPTEDIKDGVTGK